MSYPIHTIPCTAHQERLWFIEQFEKGNIYTDAPVYHNLPLLLKLAKPVQPQQLENTWQKLAQQHSLLRTRLGNRNGKPVMEIHPAATLPFAHLAVQPGTEIITESLRLTQLPFQLENEYLFRLYLITAGNGEQYMLLVAHHALADRFTLQQLAAGLLTAVFGHGYTNTENDSVNFTDFAEWQNGLSEAEQEPFIFYWKQQLQGAPVLQLDTDLPRAAIHVYRYQCRQWQSGQTLFETAQAFCKAQGVTPCVLFQALFHLLFYHYSAQTEFVTGVLYAN
ncbi:MAG: hypothetical protein JNM68_09240, partial [Dinghuibacter sp.]|nr:hypothetical protein [Dinghuibacter sp.]